MKLLNKWHVIIHPLSTWQKIKHIDFTWSERIEESVSDEVQTILDKADCTPPVVENPDSLDFDIGGNANTVGPGIGNNNNPEEFLDTIDMNHMRVLDIESVGFQTLKNGLDSSLSLYAERASSGRQKETMICGSGFPVLSLITAPDR